MEWTRKGQVFRGVGTEPVTPQITIDGDSTEGPAPTMLLLMAAGSCAGMDVVMILEKMRVTVDRLRVVVDGERATEYPRRFRTMILTFQVSGDGVERAKVERAAELSVDKYCSVLHTFAPDLHVEYRVEVS